MTSIIIPALNEAGNIRKTLAWLERLEGEKEVIVVDGGSADRTIEEVNQYPEVYLEVEKIAGRARQMNAGAKLAKGDFLFFLHADSLPHPQSIPAIERSLEKESISGGCFQLKFDAPQGSFRILEWWGRRNIAALTYGDQGLFLRKKTFEVLGGFPDIPIMEDYELASRLRKKGRFIKYPLPITTSPRRFLKSGIWRQQTRNILIALAYFAGVSPLRLKKWYTYAKRVKGEG
jgi:rSAM/selenodomain-associated transferase 2